MPVNTQHKEYESNLKKWQLVRDCDEGASKVKSRSKGGTAGTTLNGLPGTAYLPAPNASDGSDENKERYNAYRERANFVNFTGHTKEGIAGLATRKETVIDLPPTLAYLEKNANGAGLSLDQMIKDVTGDLLMVGRYGLLCDYPSTPAGLTESQVKAMDLRANILTYPTESIINWRTETIGGVTKLVMIVLQEPTEKQVDEFEYSEVMYHRVLRLVDGVYIQNLYDEDDELVVDDKGNGDIIPRNHTGGTWDEIPFVFVGSINNDSSVDKAPLYDIAEVNIAHYRNSADYEESSFLVGQPTPVFAGLTASWAKEVLGDDVALGARGAVMLPEGGSATLLQADPNQMPLEGMKSKEEQMVKIGTRIIADQGGTETAEAAKIRFTGQNSKLGSIVINTEAAFIQCCEWAAIFMGGTGEIKIEVNKEFYDRTIDPQMIISQIQLMDRGVIGVTDLRDNLRKGNLIDSNRTDEDIDGETESASPLAGIGVDE